MAVAWRIRAVKALWNNWEGPGLPGGHPFMPQKALTPRIGDGGVGDEHGDLSLAMIEGTVWFLHSFYETLPCTIRQIMPMVESQNQSESPSRRERGNKLGK